MTVPEPAGSAESLQIDDLLPQTTYYFAVHAMDDTGQNSVLSNVLQVTTGVLDDTEPPAILMTFGLMSKSCKE